MFCVTNSQAEPRCYQVLPQGSRDYVFSSQSDHPTLLTLCLSMYTPLLYTDVSARREIALHAPLQP